MTKFREIVESILKESTLYEMSYPTDFDLNYFSSLKTFKDRIAYCQSKLERLGSGSSRIVFKVDDEKVLKIAKNKIGIEQNIREKDFSDSHYSCLAKIFASDKNGLWIEMELAKKAKREDFLNHFDFEFSWLHDMLMFMYNTYSNEKYKFIKNNEGDFEKFFNDNVFNEKNEELLGLYQYITDYQPDEYTISDMCVKSNWGIVNRDGKECLVIIDNGYDETINKKFYR